MKQDFVTTNIEPPHGFMNLNIAELWHNRELLYFLCWRDIKVKYKQTALGFMWAIIVPLVNMVIFGTIFGRVGGLPTNGLNPYLSYLAVLVPWNYFATSLVMTSLSMVKDAPMLTKIYFPRLYSPLNPSFSNLVDLAIGFSILLVVTAINGIVPAATSLLLPLFVVWMMLVGVGIGSFLSALNVRYRDVSHMVPFLVQIWMYMTVLTSFSGLPERWGAWRFLYGINPMVGAVEGFRWALLNHHMVKTVNGAIVPVLPAHDLLMLMAAGLPAMIGMLALGLYYFKRTERIFADVV